jgi:hypothetical protein
VREYCPHMIGWKRGTRHVLGWQFAGFSERGLPAEGGWRCFDVDELVGVIVRPGPWYRGWTTGRGQQHCIDQIELVVAAELAAEVRVAPGIAPSRGR